MLYKDLIRHPWQPWQSPFSGNRLSAAYLAGLATGIWKSLDEVSGLDRPHDRFEPNMPASQRDALLNGWHDAVRRALSTREGKYH